MQKGLFVFCTPTSLFTSRRPTPPSTHSSHSSHSSHSAAPTRACLLYSPAAGSATLQTCPFAPAPNRFVCIAAPPPVLTVPTAPPHWPLQTNWPDTGFSAVKQVLKLLVPGMPVFAVFYARKLELVSKIFSLAASAKAPGTVTPVVPKRRTTSVVPVTVTVF